MKRIFFSVALSSSLLAACSGSEQASNTSENASSSTRAVTGNTRATGNMRVSADCANLARDAGKPDIIGIQIGMMRQTALSVLQCSDAKFEISSLPGSGSFQLQEINYRPQTPIIVARASGQTVTVFAAGAPGKEVVVAVEREAQYGENPPTMDAAVAQLGTKYGSAFVELRYEWKMHSNYQIKDRQGIMMTRAHPDFYDCFGVAEMGRDGTDAVIQAKCGNTVFYRVTPNGTNAGLAHVFKVALMDNGLAKAKLEENVAALASASSRAAQQEIEKAKSSADLPDL